MEEEKDLFKETSETIINPNDSEIVKKIKALLDEYVRPAVERDGGNIIYDSYDEENGVVKVKLQGSCSGCPSASQTLKGGIENLLMRFIPEVKLVEAAEV